MIKKNKKQLIISSVIILLPVLMGLIMWNILPEKIATHWNSNGVADGFSGRSFTIFGIPLIMLVLHWICVLATALDSKSKEQNPKVIGMVLWILPLTSLLLNGMVYAVALGNEINVDIIVRILLGLMFVLIGNYLPKCTRNHTIGVKVTWALRNEENWNKTHRFTGRLWVLGGVFLLATMFIPMKDFLFPLLAFILIMSFVPMIYSYVYYKKQLKSKTATTADAVMTPSEKKTTKISLAIGIIILSFAAIFLFTGDFEVQFDDTSFTIKAAYWDDATVNYADVTQLEYREQDDPEAASSRTFGYGSFTLLMGEFTNDEFGRYTRYSYMSCDSCLVLTIDDKTLIINGKTAEETLNLYNELVKRTQHN